MPDSKFINYKNKKIHYLSSGKGRPIVLLHGLPANSSIWNNLTIELQNEFFVIAPDIPGSGKSEMLSGENTFQSRRPVSLEDYAEVIKNILEEENIMNCTMIGHSMGGYITLAFADKYPESLNGIGLFHSSAFADDDEKKQTRRKAIEFIKANGAYLFLKTLIPNLFADKQHQKEINDLIEKGKNYNHEALIQYYQAMINRPDRTEVLKTFEKPVLFIIGEKDYAIPLDSSLQQCYLPSISHVNILEAGHMGMIEQAEKCTNILFSFLNN